MSQYNGVGNGPSQDKDEYYASLFDDSNASSNKAAEQKSTNQSSKDQYYESLFEEQAPDASYSTPMVESQDDGKLPQSNFMNFLKSMAIGAMDPTAAYRDPLDVASKRTHAKALAAGAAGLEATGLAPDLKKQYIEEAKNLSNYAKRKSENMGTFDKVLSSLAESAPLTAATMATGGMGLLAAPAVAGIDVGSEAALRQIDKYGDVSGGRAMEAGLGSALTEAALDYGMRKLPVAKPAMEFVKGLGHSGTAGAQAEAWTQYGAGQDADMGDIAMAGAAGAGLRGVMEGAKLPFGKINKHGLDAADDAQKLVNDLGTADNVVGFSRSAGRGANKLADMNEQILSNPNAERGFADYENMIKEVNTNPEIQDSIAAAAVSDLRKALGKDWVNLNLKFKTKDGRPVNEMLGMSDRDMIKSADIMHNVESPVVFGKGMTERDETTNRWLDNILEKGKDQFYGKMQGEYDTMISAVNRRINEEGKLTEGEAASDLSDLVALKSSLQSLKKSIFHNREDADLTNVIADDSALALKYAAKTGMLGSLNGIRGKGTPFNPAADDQYASYIRSSLKAVYPEVFRSETGKAVGESGGALASLSKGNILGKLPIVENIQARRMRKHREESADVFSRLSGELAKQPPRPQPPSPDEKFDRALDSGDMGTTAKAAEEALDTAGFTAAKASPEASDEAAARIDDIISPEPKTAHVAPEDVVDVVSQFTRLPTRDAARPVAPEEPAVAPEPFVDPWTGKTTDLVPGISRAEAPVTEEPVPTAPVEPVVEQPAVIDPWSGRSTEMVPKIKPKEDVVAPVEEPVVTPEVAPEPVPQFTGKATDMVPKIEPEKVKVEEPKPKPEKSTKAQDLAPRIEPKEKVKEEPVVPKEKEPEVKPEPEKKTSATEMAPKIKQKEKVEEPTPEPKAEEPKEVKEPETKKSEPLPTTKPQHKTVEDVIHAVQEAGEKPMRLPLGDKGRTRETMAKARNLRDVAKHLESVNEKLQARHLYTPEQIRDIIDGTLLSYGGIDNLPVFKNLKSDLSVTLMEANYAKRQAAIAERAKQKIEKKLERMANYREQYLERKEFRDTVSAEEKATKARLQKQAVNQSHEKIREYAESEGFSDADLNAVMKKLGITSEDMVNPVAARRELERLKANRESEALKKAEEERSKAKTESELKRQRAEIDDRINEANEELAEIAQALKKASGTTKTTLMRRMSSVNDRIKQLGRDKEDIGEMTSVDQIQKRIDKMKSQIKDSNRAVSDLENQLKQLENAMTENGGTPQEIAEYLASKFDIRKLPIESIDNARNNAVSYIKGLRAADEAAKLKAEKEAAKAAKEDLKKVAKEVSEEVVNSKSVTESQGIADAVVKQMSKMLEDPTFIREHKEAVDILKQLAEASKTNSNMVGMQSDYISSYYDLMNTAFSRKANGVDTQDLLTRTELEDIRSKYQRANGFNEQDSSYVGGLWKKIRTALTGNSAYKFRTEKSPDQRQGALPEPGLKSKIKKQGDKARRDRKSRILDIDEF